MSLLFVQRIGVIVCEILLNQFLPQNIFKQKELLRKPKKYFSTPADKQFIKSQEYKSISGQFFSTKPQYVLTIMQHRIYKLLQKVLHI